MSNSHHAVAHLLVQCEQAEFFLMLLFCYFLLGIVGEIGESNDEYYIWTHKKLDIGYNGDQIVDVTLTSESKTKLSPNAKISFTYEVKQSLLLVSCTINCYKDFYDW